MVDFACSHCATAFSVADDLAGRQGWCRACKRLIVVPKPDGSGGIGDLSIDERCERLDRLAQYAAAKADRCRLLLYQIQQENEKLSLRAGAADEHALRLHSAEQRLAEAQGTMEGLVRELERGAAARTQLYEQNGELHRLNTEVLTEAAREKTARANAEKRLSDARRLRRDDRRRHEEEAAVLREQMARLEAVAADNGEWEAVLRERDHLRGALNAAQEQRRDAEQRLAQAEDERNHIQDLLDKRREQQQSADGGAEELRNHIGRLECGLAEAEAAWEASEQQRHAAEEEAARLRRELGELRKVEKQHKALLRAHETLEQEKQAREEALTTAEGRAAAAADRLAGADKRVTELAAETAALRADLAAAERARDRAVKEANEVAAKSAMVNLAGLAGAGEMPQGAESAEDGDVDLPRWSDRGGAVELVPVDESGGEDGIILAPELLGGDSMMDDFMRFLAPEAELDDEEMPEPG